MKSNKDNTNSLDENTSNIFSNVIGEFMSNYILSSDIMTADIMTFNQNICDNNFINDTNEIIDKLSDIDYLLII